MDRGLRALTLLSLAVFAMAALVLGMASTLPGLVLLSIAIWGLTFGGAPTLLQTAVADTAGVTPMSRSRCWSPFSIWQWQRVASLVGCCWRKEGPSSFPPTLLVLVVVGLVVVWQAWDVGFKLAIEQSCNRSGSTVRIVGPGRPHRPRPHKYSFSGIDET